MKTKNFVLTGMAILTLALSSGTAAGAKPKTAELTTAKEFFAFHAKADEELKNWSGDFTMVMSVASGKVQFSGNIRAKGDLARFHIQVDVMGRTMTFELVLDSQGSMWVEMERPGMPGQQKLVLKGMLKPVKKRCSVSWTCPVTSGRWAVRPWRRIPPNKSRRRRSNPNLP